ncbi:MAG: alanine dehydrogenase [Firmicutes bacterium]|nr:alanine dehydrogenase [Bacillota bacterium]
MHIGVPKEIKEQEARVALTPGGSAALIAHGHEVLIEAGAGVGSGFTDAEYAEAGARIVGDAATVWRNSEMVVKVKEPLPQEYPYLREGLLLFTYLHLAANRALTTALISAKVTALGYETIQLPDGTLPLLVPMSEIAGRLSVQEGVRFLEATEGGKGILVGGAPGVPSAQVVIIGGGNVGLNAARIATGMGAHVTVVEKNPLRLRYLDELFGHQIDTLASNDYTVASAVAKADLLIGAVLIPGARAPQVVSEQMVSQMTPGSVIVDVAVDQGGSIATIDHTTTHENPVYERYGILHYAVANMPGAVPRTSTWALTNSTLAYVQEIADLGLREAVRRDPSLAGGVNVYQGQLCHPAVAEAHQMTAVPLTDLLD